MILLGSFMVSCDARDIVWKYEEKEAFSNTIAVGGQSSLEITSVNGSIDVTGVPGADTVEIRGEKIVKSDDSQEDALAALADLKISTEEKDDKVVVTSNQPDDDDHDYNVEYIVTVSADWKIDLKQVNGSISISSVDEEVSAETTNGSVLVDECKGSIVGSTTNGELVFIDVDGSIEGKTTNGSIEAIMTLAAEGRCLLDTSNGNVTLDIPAATSADLSASVQNGRIEHTGLTFSDLEESETSLVGMLGEGNGEIDLETTNGSIEISGS
jgi:DUF4097 and DUF4098 domain-containing protein YvlB